MLDYYMFIFVYIPTHGHISLLFAFICSSRYVKVCLKPIHLTVAVSVMTLNWHKLALLK